MGKVSPKEKTQKTPRQKRRSRSSSNKYLKPGALAQIRYSKALAAKSCTDLGKKRVALLGVGKKVNDDGFLMGGEVIEASPPTVLPSPQTFCFSPVGATRDRAKLQRSILASPKTPVARVCDSESRLEALPLELLINAGVLGPGLMGLYIVYICWCAMRSHRIWWKGDSTGQDQDPQRSRSDSGGVSTIDSR